MKTSLLAFAFLLFGFSAEASQLRPGDRIVFVGDSITGQGAGADGWARLVDEALKATHPDGNFTLISLGGSGQGVGTWQAIEEKSRTESVILDVKTIDVKQTLDQPANVVISMLGMNDVLFPRLQMTDADYDKWIAAYRELIDSIRERTKPRVFALATPTMCTEDPASPKNEAMRALHTRLRALGQSEGFIILPTYETMQDVLNEGRTFSSRFHVTGDSVHPNFAGHLAIAMGMLRGLGEDKAAAYLYEKYAPRIFGQGGEAIPWRVENLPAVLDSESQRYRIRYANRSGEKVDLVLPTGWRVASSASEGDRGEFVVEGTPDRLTNSLTLRSGATQSVVSIPAPWLIGTGAEGLGNWIQHSVYDPDKLPHPEDDTLSRAEGFGQIEELGPDRPITWMRHSASMDLAGGNEPGAIDMAGVTFFQNFDVAYGARWIYSDRERSLTVQVRPSGFANGSHLAIWLNGKKVSAGHIKDVSPGEGAMVTLKKGWNALVFKSNHLQTQWQFAINLLGEGLETLKVSAVPKKN